MADVQNYKATYHKAVIGFLFATLLICSKGCMTQSAVKYAKGHPDQAWINNRFCTEYSAPNPESKPQPACYFWLPLSVPADVATSPFQLIGYGLMYGGEQFIGHLGG